MVLFVARKWMLPLGVIGNVLKDRFPSFRCFGMNVVCYLSFCACLCLTLCASWFFGLMAPRWKLELRRNCCWKCFLSVKLNFHRLWFSAAAFIWYGSFVFHWKSYWCKKNRQLCQRHLVSAFACWSYLDNWMLRVGAPMSSTWSSAPKVIRFGASSCSCLQTYRNSALSCSLIAANRLWPWYLMRPWAICSKGCRGHWSCWCLCLTYLGYQLYASKCEPAIDSPKYSWSYDISH